ncbi:Cytochrome c oxidase subunit 3 [Methyloligella halotolerans]|uniref:Cytochrome c oxidase subunit 3 n=1 Tax=Methyloligella halotolerans TaxID=1177755 RepID=A0A1E2RYC6_9HYPH|nr:cytochrome c oxidase subunit 3 [Methyloligella halotolerans]ODA67233.1 Cytochrome c oxidase subunit 3 [Methyloligella halotolerans]
MAETHAKHHDYHLLDPSPWPIVGSISAFVLAVGAVQFLISHKAGASEPLWLLPGIILVFFTMIAWWSDVIKEGRQNDHTPVVQLHFRYGMILFIASEVMFFVAWFWAYFDVALYPDEAVTYARTAVTGGVWPPVPSADTDVAGLGWFANTFNPWSLPLVNTLILLLSGTTVTYAHHALLENNRKGVVRGLIATVILGMIFTAGQVFEYLHAGFSFSDHIYGSTFFMATGFHGFHVIVGTIFLAICLLRAWRGAFTPERHFGFEAAAWYWHFVDVVWLFLFASIYIWGGGSDYPAH